MPLRVVLGAWIHSDGFRVSGCGTSGFRGLRFEGLGFRVLGLRVIILTVIITTIITISGTLNNPWGGGLAGFNLAERWRWGAKSWVAMAFALACLSPKP